MLRRIVTTTISTANITPRVRVYTTGHHVNVNSVVQCATACILFDDVQHVLLVCTVQHGAAGSVMSPAVSPPSRGRCQQPSVNPQCLSRVITPLPALLAHNIRISSTRRTLESYSGVCIIYLGHNATSISASSWQLHGALPPPPHTRSHPFFSIGDLQSGGDGAEVTTQRRTFSASERRGKLTFGTAFVCVLDQGQSLSLPLPHYYLPKHNHSSLVSLNYFRAARVGVCVCTLFTPASP